MYSLFFLAATSFILCLVLTPLIRRGFHRFGLLDEPKEDRKIHAAAVPRVGGIGILVAYLGALGLLHISPLHASTLNVNFVWTLIPAVLVVFSTGLIDDLFGLKPWLKLLGQICGALMAYWAGIHMVGAGGYAVHNWWTMPLTILWLVGCANAFNLIDGLDGLAAGIGLFATMTIFVAALLQNNIRLALVTAPLAGALLGFLRYNFNPASIFLGDCGSMSVGFLLGCYGALWSQKSATLLGMTAPLMALSIPLLDAALAVIRRFLRRQPIFSADRRHIHHRLLDRGYSPRHVVLVLYAVCGVAAIFSLLATMPINNNYGGLILVLFCGVAWIGVQHLGYSEFGTARELVLLGTFRRILGTQIDLRNFEQNLREAANLEECWRLIRETTQTHGFASVRLQLAGQLFEEHMRNPMPERCWTLRIPLADGEYLNLTHASGGSVHPMLVATPLADVLQRVLRSHLEQWRPMVAMPGPPVQRINGQAMRTATGMGVQ